MNLRTFIERPVFSAVISITIVILGIIGLFTLPVEQYPDIAPPTIMVSTTYYGASAETLQKSVIAPLEEAINGVEDMTYMTSTASNAGSVSITVYFKQGTDPDMAAVNVQNRVSKATGQLPAEVTQVGVTTSKRQTSILQMFSLYSPDDSYDENFLANYISINLKPQILRISGVGDIHMMGSEYSMRIWLNPQRMAQYGLMPSDISAVLNEQNVEAATGTLGEESDNTYQYILKYRGRYETAEEFEKLQISDGEKLCIVAQTTFNYNKFQDLVEKISKTRYDILVLNTICNATQERQVEARQIASQVDVMIVIGGRNSSNTQKLYEICRRECKETYYIQTLKDFKPEKAGSVRSVGITAGASTPNQIIEEVHTNVRIKF